MSLFEEVKKLFFKNQASTVGDGVLRKKVLGINWSGKIFRSEYNIQEWRNALNTAMQPPYYDRTLLYELYEVAMQEECCFSQIELRKNGTIGEPFVLLDKNKKENTEATELLQKQWFSDLISYILDSIYWGYSVVEFNAEDWTKNGKRFTQCDKLEARHISPERQAFIPDPLNIENTISLQNELVANWILCFGKKRDLGLLLRPAKRVIYKDLTFSDWGRFNEKYGSPYTVLKTNRVDKTELAEYEEMLENYASNGWAIIDIDDDLQSIQANKTDAHETFLMLINKAEELITKSIVAQNATSDEKSYVGAAEVQERKLDWFIESDMIFVENNINDFVLPFLAKKGYPVEGLKFHYRYFLATENTTAAKEQQQNNEQLSYLLDKNNPFTKGCGCS